MNLEDPGAFISKTPASYENLFSGTQKSSVLEGRPRGTTETTPKGGAIRILASDVVSGTRVAAQSSKIDESRESFFQDHRGGYPCPGREARLHRGPDCTKDPGATPGQSAVRVWQGLPCDLDD